MSFMVICTCCFPAKNSAIFGSVPPFLYLEFSVRYQCHWLLEIVTFSKLECVLWSLFQAAVYDYIGLILMSLSQLLSGML